MKYHINISVKDGVLDPEMETLHRLLKRSGVKGIRKLNHTQRFEIDFEEGYDEATAGRIADAVARDVLANPEIHDWTIEKA